MDREPFAGRVAVIAGGAGGIGGAIAWALGRLGAQLILAGRDASSLVRQRELLCGRGLLPAVVHVAPGDLREVSTCERIVAQAEGLGGLDVVVNAAGVGRFATFLEMSAAEVDEVVTSHLMTTMRLCHAALPALCASRGHIINITSGLSKRASAGAVAYCAAKYGVQGFSEALRLEVARHGVRVTCLAPAGAGVDTPFWEQANPEISRAGMLAPERVADMAVVVLLSRAGAGVDEVVLRGNSG